MSTIDKETDELFMAAWQGDDSFGRLAGRRQLWLPG